MAKDKDKILKEISEWLDSEAFELAKDTMRKLIDLTYDSLVEEVKANEKDPRLTLVEYEVRFYQIYLVYLTMLNGLIVQTLADVKAELAKKGLLE